MTAEFDLDKTRPIARAAALPLAALAVALLPAACSGGKGGSSASGSAAIHVVERGPLRVAVREAAELKAAVETEIKSDIEGRSTIIYLIPEGSSVEKGQRIVELDVSELEERRATQRISVERARAALVNAQQDAEILEKELAAANAEATSEVEIAQIDREKFLGRPTSPEAGNAATEAAPVQVEGGAAPPGGAVLSTADALRVDDPQRGTNGDMIEQLRSSVANTQYESLPDQALELLGRENLGREVGEFGEQIVQQIVEISLARQKLALAKDTLDHSVELQKKDYITKNELEGDRLDFESQQSQVKLAWQALDILISYTLRKTKIDLQLKLDNAQLNLEKVRADAAAKRLRSESDLASCQEEYDLSQERLQNLEQQIQNAVIRAPTPGLIVYAELDGRGNDMVQEGIEVRERQTIVLLPDVTRMVAELKVQEADVDKVRAGQPAVVKVDALPGVVLTGRVQRVSPLADSGSRWSNNNLKVYKTWVALDGDNVHELRPNMSAEVEILVGEIPDTIAIPLTAVRRQGRVHYVWKATNDGSVATPVEVGQSTVTQVEIIDGLAAGDRIYLAPPPGAVPPDLPQPPELVPDEMAPAPSDTAAPADGAAAPTAEDAALAPSEPVTRESFQAALLAAHPGFAAKLEDAGPRALFSDPEIRSAIEADPKLQAMAQALREQMMQRMRERGMNGEGGPRRQRDGNAREGGQSGQ